jgi:hypothetical protein
MLIACPGEFPVYQMLPAPLAPQQGAFVGYEGVGPTTGFTLPFSFTMAKLSGLCAGVTPGTLPQNAFPSATVSVFLGTGIGLLVLFNPPPCCVSGSYKRDPELSVTAAQLSPTTICAAEGSERRTTGPSTNPQGQAWISAQFAPTTNGWSRVNATASGLVHSQEWMASALP